MQYTHRTSKTRNIKQLTIIGILAVAHGLLAMTPLSAVAGSYEQHFGATGYPNPAQNAFTQEGLGGVHIATDACAIYPGNGIHSCNSVLQEDEWMGVKAQAPAGARYTKLIIPLKIPFQAKGRRTFIEDSTGYAWQYHNLRGDASTFNHELNSFQVGQACHSQGAGPCEAGDFYFPSAIATLEDTTPPTITPHKTGLFDPNQNKFEGTVAVKADITDNGKGPQNAEILIDGQTVAKETWPDSVCNFRNPQPCPDRPGWTKNIDTTVYQDGVHTIRIKADDGAGNQTYTDRTIKLENHPAPKNVQSPFLEGMAVQDERLTLDQGRWEGEADLDFQWKRCDVNGVRCDAFTPAHNYDYQLSERDVGSRVAVDVTAISRGGKQTTVTTPVSDVVKAKPRSFTWLEGPDAPAEVPANPLTANNALDPGAGSSLLIAPAGTHFRYDKNVHRGKARAKYRQPTTIRGTLLDGNNRPLPGLELQVQARGKDGKQLPGKVVRTDKQGRYRYTSRGPSRNVNLSYHNVASDTKVAVGGKIRLRVPAKAKRGRKLLFQGRVLGGHIPKKGVAVAIQVHRKGKWRVVKTGKTKPSGKYRITWPKLTAAANRQYKFRARVIPDSKWGYENAISPTKKMTVQR